MKYIELTQGYKAMIDDEDYDLVSRYCWHVAKCKNNLYVRTDLPLTKKRIRKKIVLCLWRE